MILLYLFIGWWVVLLIGWFVYRTLKFLGYFSTKISDKVENWEKYDE